MKVRHTVYIVIWGIMASAFMIWLLMTILKFL